MSRTVKAVLVVLLILAAVGVAIGYAVVQESGYLVLWEGKAEGTVGLEVGDRIEPQVFEISLTASEKERILRVDPHPESGWGYPDFNIEVQLLDPDGEVIAEIPKDRVFSTLLGKQSEYAESLRFEVAKDGLYTLIVTPLTVHIDYIRLDIREKK